MIFKKESGDKVFYSIGVSKKNKDGSYINGYMPVNFKKGVDVPNKTKIKIKSAWLDFYKKEDITIPFIFINEFEEVKEKDAFEEFGESFTTKFDTGHQIEISQDDLPF